MKKSYHNSVFNYSKNNKKNKPHIRLVDQNYVNENSSVIYSPWMTKITNKLKKKNLFTKEIEEDLLDYEKKMNIIRKKIKLQWIYISLNLLCCLSAFIMALIILFKIKSII